MLSWFLSIVLAIATCLVGFLLPEYKSLDFFALLLALIAGVYVGFALRDGRTLVIVVETLVALLFVVLALVGLWKDPLWLVVGYFGHGLWDLLNHFGKATTTVPRWYPPACVVYDWVVGAFILFMWRHLIFV